MADYSKLQKAKAQLVLHQPFFASLLFQMPMIEDDTIPTMAVDGTNIYYNAKFVDEMTQDEAKFVLCHEVMHCVFEHMHTRGTRNPMLWNVAGDFVINDLLTNEKIGTMPKMGLLDSALVARAGGTTVGVYDLLQKEGTGGANGKGPLDEVRDAGGSTAETEEAKAKMRVRVAQAAQAAKMCGKLSDGMKRLVDEALRPKVPWQDVLRRFISVRAKVEYSFARPKRRFVADDLYLPSLSGQMLGALVVAIDCSGSIGPKELSEFAAEIKAIKEDCLPSRVDVVYFDSEVCHHDTFGVDDELSIAPHGGGGTAFSPIFRFVEDNDLDPVACVVLTDLYCSDYGPPPSYPVLWATTGATDAPWGEVVKMRS